MRGLGIVLSGGGIRCVAQLAILDALAERGIIPDAISGSSGGALVGALVLSGIKTDDIINLVENVALYKQLKPVWLNPGFLNIEAALNVFTQRLPKTFSGLKADMHIAATNVADGRYQIFDEGNLHLAVLASCCMPVIFTPVFVNGEYYIDAGLVNNLPVEPILDCKCIVGIHTNPIQSGYTKLGTRGMLERSFLLAINGNVKLRRDRCHIYLEPQFLGEYRVFDFKKVREIYQRSQKWINERLPTLLQDIEQQMSQTG